jgi:YD repeat-containing protein
VTEYTYNQYTGNLSRIDHVNGTCAEFDFDRLDRLDFLANKKSGGTISSFDYEYHDSNLISQITLAGGSKYQYEYDDLYRLANEYSLNSQGGAIYTNGFEYDLADNRTGLADGTHEGYTLNALNQIVNIYTVGQQDPHTTFEYDLNGNMTSKTASGNVTSYDYDYENRLVKITYPDNGWTDFVYDAIGRLLTGTEKNAQGQTIAKRQYVYDGLDLLAELDGSGSLVAAYTHGPGIDDPLIVRYNGVNYVLHKNHQGSITEITNMSRTTVKTYTYDAYGAILQQTGPTLIPPRPHFTYTAVINSSFILTSYLCFRLSV